MTRDEILDRLKRERAEFDALVEAIPPIAFDRPVPGHLHSPKQIVAHVSEYEQHIVERLKAARLGETTDLDRDRLGWEALNERVWKESESADPGLVLTTSARIFLTMIEELASLEDAEFGALSRVSEAIDPGWLRGQALWEVIGVDTFEHYPMHYAQLEAAARQSESVQAR